MVLGVEVREGVVVDCRVFDLVVLLVYRDLLLVEAQRRFLPRVTLVQAVPFREVL